MSGRGNLLATKTRTKTNLQAFAGDMILWQQVFGLDTNSAHRCLQAVAVLVNSLTAFLLGNTLTAISQTACTSLHQ